MISDIATTKIMVATSSSKVLVSMLSQYHPIVIEGMGSYDPRDPALVANQICRQLESHFAAKQQQQQQQQQHNDATNRPKLVITQGDPLAPRGISAITPLVATHFGVSRGLICLDRDMASYHSPNADRNNVILELQYSQMANVLNEKQPGIITQIEERVDYYIQEKNIKRKEPLKDYFRPFALLQEVTKAACRQICNDITVIHTAQNISEFSVTSFYQVGLDLNLIDMEDIIPYGIHDKFDFPALERVRYNDSNNNVS